MNSSSDEEEFAGFANAEVVPVLKLTTSQKGKPMLSIDGALFNLNKEANNHFYWDCATRKHSTDSEEACKSRAITQVQNGAHILIHRNKPHNHDVTPLNEMEKQYKTDLKRKASESKEIPSKVVREVSATHPPIVQIRASKRAQKMIIQRKRTANDGGLRVLEKDGRFVIPEELKQTLNGQPFLQKYIRDENSHIIIFTTQPNLQRLAASRYWLVDGTFATVPLQFTQMYSIHGSVQYQDTDSVVPLVFMLLNNKAQETYTTAFEALLEICQETQIDLHPRFIILDFEKAVINVMREIFPDAECYLCYFHLTQNLLKQLNFKGLQPLYSMDMEVNLTVKRLQALSFLPSARIPEAFEGIKIKTPKNMSSFLQYFKVTYISGLNNNQRPTYHPVLWSNHKVVKEKLPLTTNSLEAWHRRWTEVVGDKHLSMTKIIMELRLEQQEIEGRILRILQGDVPQGSENYLDKIKAMCMNIDNITNEDFIESIALLLSSKQKRV